MGKWKVDRNGPNWLMDSIGRLIGYRDTRGGEHLIAQSDQLWGAADGLEDPARLTTSHVAALTATTLRMPRDINVHDLRLTEPLLTLDLPTPYSAYSGTNREHAYGTPIFFPNGFGGYRYWMVGAPYPTTYAVAATVTIATPGVVSLGVGASPPIGTPFGLTTTGALPTGLTAGVQYFVLADGWTPDGFKVSAQPGGTAINTSGVQSGVHTYKLSAPKFENPTIYVSNDGENFISPPGIARNPIADVLLASGADVNSYYADPAIAQSPDGKTLYVLWCWFNRAGSASNFMLSESSDGLTWSVPVSIASAVNGTFVPNSPTLFWNGTGWTIMAINTGSIGTNTLIVTKTASAEPYTGWAAPGGVYNGIWTQCTAPHPLARGWWHGMFIGLDGNQVAGLVVDNGSGGGAAYSLKSADGGLTFSAQPFSAWNPASAGGSWYRPGLCVCADAARTTLRLYVSRQAPLQAGSTGGFYMQTACVDAGFSGDAVSRLMLRDALHRNLVAPAALKGTGLLAWDSFNRVDSVTTLGNAESGQAWTYNTANVFGISANRAYITSATNSIAMLDVGSQDYDYEVQVQTLGSQFYLIWCVQDTANFLRYGWNGSASALQKVAGGALVNAFSVTGGMAFVAGDVIRIAKRGSRSTIYINDRPVDTISDSQFAAATKIGFQASGASATFFDNFLVRAG